MPFTFLAHQAPLLPIARRWPRRVDGITLCVGSMAPDLAYAAAGTRFEVVAHRMPAAVTVCLPLTFLVSWLIVRVLAPVVPSHFERLPLADRFDVPSYRALATHRFHPVASTFWAGVGIASHIGLDHFTHGWGWAAQHWTWYRTPLLTVPVLGAWTPFRVAQYVGHVGFTAVALLLLARYARDGWLVRRATLVTPFRPRPTSHAIVWGLAAAGCIVASTAIGSLTPWVGAFMRAVVGAFLGLVLAAVALRGSGDA